MIPKITFKQWMENFWDRLEARDRQAALNTLENLRSLSQMGAVENRMSDKQAEIFFFMLADFNRTFPDSPAYFQVD